MIYLQQRRVMHFIFLIKSYNHKHTKLLVKKNITLSYGLTVLKYMGIHDRITKNPWVKRKEIKNTRSYNLPTKLNKVRFRHLNTVAAWYSQIFKLVICRVPSQQKFLARLDMCSPLFNFGRFEISRLQYSQKKGRKKSMSVMRGQCNTQTS